MSEAKRKSTSTDKRKKKKYRSDGTTGNSKKIVDGPGIWVSCVKGKEKQTVGELYDLFDSIASEIWPVESAKEEGSDSDSSREENDTSIEAQITNEISRMKKPRKEQRFSNCLTNTPCVVFISCKPPVDPTVFAKYFGEESDVKYTYKIELRTRNHTTLTRQEIIQAIASCVPEGHIVDLTNPKLFILVEVFKSVCGVSLTKDYYSLHKYNVMEIATTKGQTELDSGRVH
ncbi:hypothetical protein D9758_012184 [Tetrapyrgos nigripes]|uniref:THUMP domain-containing protein n=1 Tax=Tetrapyrgos nigripes TaxID=182062 RepID=A0A8H5CFP1_9AGAR|nr:hypothetical protein D9758_012184 [Tetrapyrgos nigripes]